MLPVAKRKLLIVWSLVWGWAILTRPRLESKRTEGQVCSTELHNRRRVLQSFAISNKMEKFYLHLFKLFQHRFNAHAV